MSERKRRRTRKSSKNYVNNVFLHGTDESTLYYYSTEYKTICTCEVSSSRDNEARGFNRFSVSLGISFVHEASFFNGKQEKIDD